MIFGIRKEAFALVVVFTAIETAVLAIWLALAINGMLLVSILVLALGLLVEHVLATIAGTKAK
jgi:hypothetical protein